ncbi:hypothetical protein LOTGIDRAFT_159280 [Lottia gigantea]|uniref:GON domain-containing protein n=1 Tax=Lottia gigantea TaxID=225164 RepID=V4AJG9_LOTGI|nr:hypothetical protein LOTGIDRAFT_159280 [Lottia gigantea]ESO97257.1 hypothetical protein LOTGIDRAFT_159280 [Lottia gigantea]
MDYRSIWNVIIWCHLLNHYGSHEYKCFKKELLENMIVNTRLSGTPFSTFDSEILKCTQYCKLYSLCKAVNFDRLTNQCQLMNQKPTPSNTEYDSQNILIDMENWSELLLGACKHHSCPNNSICRELPDSFMCEVIGCTAVPQNDFVNVSSFEAKALWGFNEMVQYACQSGYLPSKNPICTEKGEWSDFFCKRISLCYQVYSCNQTDEDYWLFYTTSQTLIKIYCKKGSGSFISLNYRNMATFPGYTRAEGSCEKTTLDTSAESGVRITEYQKIRLDLGTFKVFTDTRRFSNSTLTSLNYGVARDCYARGEDTCGALGKFVVDTRGTGFRFTDSLAWTTVGLSPIIINITKTMDGHVITGYCGGHCGGCVINETGSGAVLEVDLNDMRPLESAVIPFCQFLI